MININSGRNIAAFSLVLGCIVSSGLFIGLSVAFLIVYFLYNSIEFMIVIRKIKRLRYMVILMVIFICGLLISSIFVSNYKGIKETFHYLERMLPFFIIWLCIFDNKNSEKYIAMGMYTGSYIICIDVLYTYFISNTSRPFGLLGSPNILGGTLILLIPFLLLYLYKIRVDNKMFCFGIGSILLVLLTLLIVKSRGAWLGLSVSVFFLSIVLYRLEKLSLKKLGLFIITMFFIGAVAYLNFSNVMNRGYDYERPALRNIAVHIFFDKPLFGIGLGNFTSRYISGSYISPLAYNEHYLSHAHNIYLKLLSETGLIGISGFLILIGFQLKLIWYNITVKNRERSLYAAAIFFGMCGMLSHGWFDVCFSARYYAMLYWCLWGIVYYHLEFENNLDIGANV